MVGRKTSRRAGDDRSITFSGKASSNILTIREWSMRLAGLPKALEERQDSDQPAGDASSLHSRVASGPQHVPRSLSGCQLSRIGVHPVKNCHKGVKMWT